MQIQNHLQQMVAAISKINKSNQLHFMCARHVSVVCKSCQCGLQMIKIWFVINFVALQIILLLCK